MKLAWLFPGQGAQTVGMGADVAEQSAAAREVFARADAALGSALSELCFEGPAEELALTANTQPAILTTSCAMLAALRERFADQQPDAAAGHSLGEYSALVASGALRFEDAVRLVRLRGEAMQHAVPAGEGAMLAVMGGDEAKVQQLCDRAAQGQVLTPANFNCPGQVVIAGHASAVQRAAALAGESALKAIPLKVSAPFHCSLMAPAAQRVQAALSEISISELAFPIVSNVEALPNQDPTRVSELLVRQVDGAVRWQQTVQWLVEQGITHALEIGPGRVLAGLIRKTAPSLKVLSVRDLASLDQVESFLSG